MAALVSAYGGAPAEQWLRATARIRDRTGAADADLVADRVRAGDLPGAVEILVRYYDARYRPHRAGLTGPVIAHADVDATHAGPGVTPCQECRVDVWTGGCDGEYAPCHSQLRRAVNRMAGARRG